MKYLILAVSLMISGCSCCSTEQVQYIPIDTLTVVNDRFITVPEILVDGVTTDLTQEDLGWTFSDVFTDSATGKKIEVSGVIPKKKDKIHLSARVPKDSVRVQDTAKTVTRQAVKEKGFLDGVTLKDILIVALIIAVLSFLTVWFKK